MAFNAKNLSYDRNEPAFLRRLRDQYGGADSDRHQRQLQRPRKQKDNDDDDGPVYVDEETNETISKEDYESLVKDVETKDGSSDHHTEAGKESINNEEATEQNSNEDAKVQPNITEIGAQKKRRMAKVIHEEEVAEDKSQRKDNSAAPRPKAKKKKIKLSFDEPE